MFFARTILTIGFLIGVVFLAPPSGLACGFNWSPFSGYFECCDDSGYVLLTEKLADLSIPGKDGAVPIWMWFSSKTAAPSPYAGMWHIGILEVSLMQSDEKQFSLRDPGGSATLLSWDKKKNVLEGSGWKGEVTGDRAKLWASCGWSVEFSRGKVSRMMTPHKKTLVYAYADGRVTGISCDGKPLIALGSLKGDALEITVNGKKRGIVLADQPCVRRGEKADAVAETVKSLAGITGEDGKRIGRSYAYTVDDKMRPVIAATGGSGRDTFTLVWEPQTRKVVRYKDWEYTKVRDRKSTWDTIELRRKNEKGEVESVYRDINGGIDITQRGKTKHSEYRFTSGPAAGKVRRIEDTEDGKVTHFQKYAYDQKGRPIRGQEDGDRLCFEYDDKNRTAAVWRNDKLLWRKFMDERGRIVKVEYPDGKELRLAYPERRPATAELVWGKASVVAQLTREGLVKEGSAIIRGIPR